MKNTNHNSTKEELITASMEYLDWIETNTYTKKTLLFTCLFTFVLGYMVR